MKHRREIDGLRAVAVLPVIFFMQVLRPLRVGLSALIYSSLSVVI